MLSRTCLLSEAGENPRAPGTRHWFFGLAVLLLLSGGAPAALRGDDSFRPEVVVGLLELILDVDPESARGTLGTLREKIVSGELSEQRVAELRPRLESLLKPIQEQGAPHPLHADAILLAAAWGDSEAARGLSDLFENERLRDSTRAEAVRLWLGQVDSAEVPGRLRQVRELLEKSTTQPEFQQLVLQAVGQNRHPEVATFFLEVHQRLNPTLRSQVIELMTRRAAWSKALLREIDQQRLPASVLNANQVARLQSSPDESLVELSRQVWGTVRLQRNPDRQRVIHEVRELIEQEEGNPFRGREVFRKVCANCHVMHGEGHDVGPDITRNGRGSLEQLLSNVLDPSLVIGASYQGRIVVTEQGQVLTGLVIEENEQRVVLKLPGGERESIRQEEIETMHVSELSLMPEGLEEQLERQELIDLFAFLQLDKPPEDPTARRIPPE